MGLRKRAMISGVNRIHQRPCDADWMPSRRPDWHQSAMVETVTLSISAATFAVHRPSPGVHRHTPRAGRDSRSGLNSYI